MSEAELSKARRHAEQPLVQAESHSEQAILARRGEAQRILQVGLDVKPAAQASRYAASTRGRAW
jgi:hypothetical protein